MSSLVTWWRYVRKKVSEVTAYVVVTNSGVSITSPAYNGSVTRASIALQFNHATSSYTQVSSGQDRCQHDVYSSGLAAWELNQRPYGEPQRTNSALGSADFDNAATYWSKGLAQTITTVTSCLPGQTAYRHLSVADAPNRFQTIGTFVNGQTDCVGVIVENDATVPATVTDVAIYDSTAGATLARVELTWSTLAVAVNAGSAAAKGVQNLGIGPNGGQMVLLWVTATGTASGTGANGNGRRVFVYPTGLGSTSLAVILHHAQFEANALFPSTPIVTGAATATRNAEIVSVPLPAAAQSAQALAIYDKWVAQGGYLSTTTGYRWNIGGSTAPLLSGQFNSSSQPTMTINNGTDAAITDTAPAVAPSFADLMETRGLLASTGTVQTGAAKNAGSETLAAASSAPASGILLPYGEQKVYLGSKGSTAGGGQALGTFIIAAGAPSMNQFRGM